MEKLIDIKEVKIVQKDIDFSEEENTFVFKGQLKFYIGDKVELDNYDNEPNRSIEDFASELVDSGTLIVYKADNEKGDNVRYHAITKHYYFHFCMSSIMGDNDFTYRRNIAIYDVIAGKSQIAACNNANRSKKIKIKSNFYFGICSKKYGQISNVSDWNMNNYVFDEINNLLIDTFDQDLKKDNNISEFFKDNITNTIYQINEAERKIEEDKTSAGSHLKYSDVKIEDDTSTLNNKDRDASYLLFSLNVTSSTFETVYQSTYQEGTNVIVPLNNNGKISGRVEFVDFSDEYVKLRIVVFQQFSSKDLMKTGEIKLKPNLTQYRVRNDIVKKLRNKTIESQYMYDTFSDFSTKPLNNVTDEISNFINSKEIFEHTPPESQERAVKTGLCCNDIELVLGPPGTGKTTVIVAWIKFLIKYGKRILVSSKNNAAVDNVLERLPSEYIDENGDKRNLGIIRIGSNENKVLESCRKFLAKNRLADSQKHIEESTNEALNEINSVKNIIPVLLDKISINIKLKNQIDDYTQKISSIKADPKYINALKNRDSLQSVLQKAKNNSDILLEEISKYHTYIYDYKRLGLFGWIKEGLLGLMIILKSHKLDKKYNNTIKGLDKYNQELKEANDNLNVYNSEINACTNKIGEIINNDVLDISDDINKISIINPKIKKIYNSVDFLKIDFAEIYSLINNINLDNIANIINDWKQEINTTGNRILTDILAEESKVVGATCIGINSNKQFSNIKFDVTILDEAGQILIQDAIVPLTRSPKNILLGDYNQIPPQANDDVVNLCTTEGVDTFLLQNSFFEYLYMHMKEKSPDHIVDLDSQFRMPAILANLVGSQFYNNNYKSPLESRDSEKGVVVPGTSKPLIIIDTSKSENRHDSYISEGDHKTYCNNYDAKVVSSLIRKVFSNSKSLNMGDKKIMPYELVGVIAPYSKQIQAIRNAIKKEKIICGDVKINEYVNDMVATLDSFQGQERPLIIFDFTRSNKIPSNKSRIGFLRELRRLNVAFTRSKQQLVIIGDMDYLTSCKYVDNDSDSKYKSEEEFSRFISSVVESAKMNGQIFSSEEIING